MKSEILTGLLLNIGLLSACALLVTVAVLISRTHISAIFSRGNIAQNYRYSIFAGFAFGCTTALLIVASVRIDTGSVVDARAAPLVMAGIIGGPIAAGITAALGGIARFSVGGPFVWGGVSSIFIYALVGVLARHYLKVDLRKPGLFVPVFLVATASIATILVLPTFFFDQDFPTSTSAARKVFPLILMQNPIGVLLLGAALHLILQIMSDREKLVLVSEKLRNSNAQLNAENNRLLKFSAVAAHDLKAPTVRIATLAEFLKEDLSEFESDLPQEIHDGLNFISESAYSMGRLVDDLTKFSLMQNDDVEPEQINTSLRAQKIVEEMSLPDGFKVDVQRGIAWVRVPTTAFDIVVRNLISNAVKHHDRQTGTIKISGHLTAGFVVIKVTDDGPGVEDQFLDRIFRPMERLFPQNSEGSGLGLSFVSGLTTSWGGSANATTNKPRGLTVTITAPSIGFVSEKIQQVA